MTITDHAVQRYIERIRPALTPAQARAELAGAEKVVAIAAAFGCRVVRLDNGGHLLLDGDVILTVLPRRKIITPQERGA